MNLISTVKNIYKLAKNQNNGNHRVGKEIGNTGVQIYSGVITGEEYLTELNTLTGRLEAYDKMYRSCAQIKAIILAIILPILQAKWYVEPASDSPEDKEIAEKVEKNLFNMTITWNDYLRQALSYMWFGFSMFEKVFEFKDGIFQYRKLSPRLQKTLYKWQRDNHGGLKGIQQWAQNNEGKFEYYDIPVSKLVLFINEQNGSNFEGTSILRSAYGHWKLRNMMYEVDAIGHDRWASGIPVITESEIPNPADTARAETILENLHSRVKSWAVMPHGYTMQMFEKAGNNIGVLKSIQHHTEEMGKSVLTQFINLGTTATGSRALGEAFEELFMLSLNARANYFANVNNKYVIPQMVDYNWTVKEYPKLKHGTINLNTYKWVESVTKAKSGGVITTDIGVENHVRDIMGLPEKDEEEFEEQKKEKIEIMKNIQKTINNKDEEKEEEEEKQKQFSLSEKKFRRKLTEVEIALADFDTIVDGLDNGLDTWIKQAQKIRKQQIAEVAKQVVKKAPDKVQVPYVGKMADRLFDEAKKMYKKGRIHVREEISRQRIQIKKMSDKPELFTSPDDFEDSEEVLKYLKDRSKADAVSLSNGLLNSALFAMYNIDTVGMKQGDIINEIERRLKDTGTRELTSKGNASINSAYSMGREVQASNMTTIEYAVYSAILDGNACSECLPRDGVKHEVDDHRFQTPNPECLGGGRCRCVNIYALQGMEGEFETKSIDDYRKDAKAIKDGSLDFEKMRKRYE